MKREKKTTLDFDELQNISLPAFSYRLLRFELIPELLGKEQPSLLYWSGRNLARKYPLKTLEDITAFFQVAGWGTLTVQKEKKHQILFHLHPAIDLQQIPTDKEISFALEIGFLAEQMQTIKNRTADGQERTKKGQEISFVIEWDPKDPID